MWKDRTLRAENIPNTHFPSSLPRIYSQAIKTNQCAILTTTVQAQIQPFNPSAVLKVPPLVGVKAGTEPSHCLRAHWYQLLHFQKPYKPVDIRLAAGNQVWWECLYHRNQQMLQIRALPREPAVNPFPGYPQTRQSLGIYTHSSLGINALPLIGNRILN